MTYPDSRKPSILVIGKEELFQSLDERCHENGVFHLCTELESALLEYEQGRYDLIMADYLSDLETEFLILNSIREGFGEVPLIYRISADEQNIRREAVLHHVYFISFSERTQDLATMIQEITRASRESYQKKDIAESYSRLKSALIHGFATLERDGSTSTEYYFSAVNPSLEQILGVTQEEIIGNSTGYLFPETGAKLSELFREIERDREQIRTELYAEEFKKYLEVVAYPENESTICCLFNDITDQIQRFEETQELIQKYEQWDALSTEGSLIIGADEKINSANQAATKMLGLSELVGKEIGSLVDIHKRSPSFFEYFGQVRKEECMQIVNPDAARKQVWISGAPLVRPDGEISAVLLVLHNQERT